MEKFVKVGILLFAAASWRFHRKNQKEVRYANSECRMRNCKVQRIRIIFLIFNPFRGFVKFFLLIWFTTTPSRKGSFTCFPRSSFSNFILDRVIFIFYFITLVSWAHSPCYFLPVSLSLFSIAILMYYTIRMIMVFSKFILF